MEHPPAPSDSSDVDTLLAHQNVIANTHPDGSYFMTNEGQYVQLINGVLTNVEFQPSPPPSVVYSQPQFQVNLNCFHIDIFDIQGVPEKMVPSEWGTMLAGTFF